MRLVGASDGRPKVDILTRCRVNLGCEVGRLGIILDLEHPRLFGRIAVGQGIGDLDLAIDCDVTE